jgi:hypothetical protein
MNRTITALIFTSLVGFGVQAMADDTSGQSTGGSMQSNPAHQKFMKDCMGKAKAANNGMSEQDMKKSCKDQLKSSVDHPTEPVTPAQ